jgi:hypothetical protein
MLRVVAGTTLLRAPADRPAGQRGWRAPVALITTVAALVPLAMGTHPDPPGWTGPVMLGAAAVLLAAAIVLWTARRRAGVALAAALLAVAAMGGAVAYAAQQDAKRQEERLGGASYRFDEKGTAITPQQAESVPEGATKDEVRDILGPAAGSGVQRVKDDEDMRCLVYNDASRPKQFMHLLALCFEDGRFTELLSW